jgi:hypothetical protein
LKFENNIKRALILGILVFSSLGVVFLYSSAAYGPGAGETPFASCTGTTLSGSVLVTGPPVGGSQPDDLTVMAVRGLDHGRALLWTEWQNGVNPNGTPSSSGATQSFVTAYDLTTGALVREVKVTGHVDGLTADPQDGVIIATANEDANSTLNLIYPVLGAVATYTYSPDPSGLSGTGGGTDSIAILDDRIYISHSNPSDTTEATSYEVTLERSTLTAYLTPVFYDDSQATNMTTGATVTMALTDPDTNYVMPRSSPLFGGDLATISQGDGKIIFAAHPHNNPVLVELSLYDNVRGNVPPVDGLSVATSNSGTLFVVDSGTNTIQEFNTNGCSSGTVFIGEPSDNGNPLVGTLNLFTGQITPFGNHFVSPKGLLFVSSGNENRQ